MKKILAALLALSLALSLFGCKNTASAPTETVPVTTEPPITTAYTQAAAPLRDAQNLKVELTTKKEIVGLDGSFTTISEQELTLIGIGTDSFLATMEEDLKIGDQSDEFTECFAEDVLYVDIADSAFFQGEMTAEEFTARFAPAVLLDETLYADVTIQEAEHSVTMTFADPAGPETWALPQDATFLNASGTAKISDNGTLAKTVYTIEYSTGNTTVSMDVTAEAEIYDEEAPQPPQNPFQYKKIDAIDAPKLLTTAAMYLYTGETASYISDHALFSQAAGAAMTIHSTLHYVGTGENLIAEIEHQYAAYDSAGNTDTYTFAESFRDGEYSSTEDDGEPTKDPTVSEEDMLRYVHTVNLLDLFDGSYISAATLETVNGLYYLEMEMTPQWGKEMSSNVSGLLLGNPDILNDNATDYKTTVGTQYLTIQPATGLPVAAGYTYEGVHTIEGQECTLSEEATQSFCLIDSSTYTELTDQNALEAAPDEQATPLLYKVTGTDGQEMYLMGTIHVGDAKTAFLPEEVYETFDACDALAVEANVLDFEDTLKKDPALAAQIAEAYFYASGESAKDHLDEEVYDQVVKLLKLSGQYNTNMEFARPFVWSSALESFFLTFSSLRAEKGMDMRLLMRAKEQGKEILEVEDTLSHYDMYTSFSDELWQMELEAHTEYTIADYSANVHSLYDLWCEGDEEALRAYLAEEFDEEMTEEERALTEEYIDAMIIKRNEQMLQVAISYLEGDKTVFYAVGLAHLLQENGLVDTLREAGYTVEQVIYS